MRKGNIVVAIDGSGSMRWGQAFQKAAKAFNDFREKLQETDHNYIQLHLILFSNITKQYPVNIDQSDDLFKDWEIKHQT